MSLYEPARGGNRGGKDQFAWEDVKSDKYRENYLAHSLMAPVGRWQKGRDLTWYTKESKVSGRKEALRNEVEALKRAEEEAMARALGHKLPPAKPVTPAGTSNLSKRELIDVCRRRSSEGGATDRPGREIIEGMGYKSQKRQLMGGNTSEEGMTSFERDGDKDTERLVLQKTGERERISSISSSEFGPNLPPEAISPVAPFTEKTKKEKHSKKKKSKLTKTLKKEKKLKDRHKHRRRKATPTSSDSSSDEDSRIRRKRGKHRYHDDSDSEDDKRRTRSKYKRLDS